MDTSKKDTSKNGDSQSKSRKKRNLPGMIFFLTIISIIICYICDDNNKKSSRT